MSYTRKVSEVTRSYKIVGILEGVIEIGYQAFHRNKDIVEVRVSSNLKRIGGNAFFSCSNLKN